MSTLKTATNVWIALLEDLYQRPDVVQMGRGTRGKELLGHQICIDQAYPIVRAQERRINYKFLAAGALWHINGDNDVQWLSQFSKGITEFYAGRFAFGAYGPLIKLQLPYIIQTLSEDPYSRQAVMNIWSMNPHVGNKDTSCLLSLHFIIRDSIMHTIVSMRSSDAWLGLPYDLFDFTMISAYVALLLPGIVTDLGTLVFNSGSQHLYEKFFESTEKLLYDSEEYKCPINDNPFSIKGYNSADDFKNYLYYRAHEKYN